MISKLSNKDDMISETENGMVVTAKVKVPHNLTPILNDMLRNCTITVKEMLKDRSKLSSKYFKRVPCVVAKSLIVKYQKNPKCKHVRNITIPICGDKGKQVKLTSGNKIRVPSLFKKTEIEIYPLKPISGFIRSVEFFKKQKVWYMSYTYNTDIYDTPIIGLIGVDRNARGNIATIADLQTGKAKKLGIDIQGFKYNFRKRRAKLQKKRKARLLVKINRKQSNRTKDLNHKVSKTIVDYSVKHRSAIILEDLSKIKDSKKCGQYVKNSNWSYFQLERFICYKAALYRVPVYYVDPAYTSKMCSKCGHINEVKGKKFVCSHCGHVDHRDVNAAFNIAKKFLVGQTTGERVSVVGHTDIPQMVQGFDRCIDG